MKTNKLDMWFKRRLTHLYGADLQNILFHCTYTTVKNKTEENCQVLLSNNLQMQTESKATISNKKFL